MRLKSPAPLIRIAVTAGFLLLAVSALAGPPAAYEAWRARLQSDLVRLADQGQLPDGFQPLIAPHLPDRLTLYLPEPEAPSMGARQSWSAALRARLEHAADQLFQLVLEHRAADPAEAYRRLHEVLHWNPQHPQAAGLVASPAAAPQATRGRRRERQLQWAAGEYWEIRSENFLVLTDGDPAPAMGLAEQLERLYRLWLQVFFELAVDSSSWANLPPDQPWQQPRRPKMRAVLFSSRDTYLAQLRPVEPRIDVTLGYYSDHLKTSFYYVQPPTAQPAAAAAPSRLLSASPIATTWWHETTHQLFQQRRATTSQPAWDEGMAVLEGVALFFESLRPGFGYYTLGGIDAARLQAARHRVLVEGEWLPMRELLLLSRAQLQGHPEIRAIYSQAAGVSQFFLVHPEAAYRTAFLQALDGLYAGQPAIGPLLERLGAAGDEIDPLYTRFLQVTDQQLARACLAGGNCRQLLLGNTSITDAGVIYLSRLSMLEELDLQQTAVTDAGLAEIDRLAHLTELNLAGTRITDRTLARLAALPRLQWFDATGTPSSEAARQRLWQQIQQRTADQ